MTRLYLVRHCEAQGNIAGVYHGVFDSDITPRGALQLQALSKRFAKVRLDAVYSSPLRRARLTAQAIKGDRGGEIIIEPQLIEQDGGVWECRKWNEIMSENPDQMECWFHDTERFAPPGGEGFGAVMERMKKVCAKIAADNPGKTVAAATHAGALRAFTAYVKGVGVKGINSVAWAENTAVYAFDYADDGGVTLAMENDTGHLTDDLFDAGKLI